MVKKGTEELHEDKPEKKINNLGIRTKTLD